MKSFDWMILIGDGLAAAAILGEEPGKLLQCVYDEKKESFMMSGDCGFQDPEWNIGCPYWNPVELCCEVPCPEACPWYGDDVEEVL